LLAAALVTWLVRRRRAALPMAAPAVPALEPDVEAKRALEALIASGKLARGELRAFYIELTAIAKRYLERRLDAPIAEMTSAEMVAHLREHPLAIDLAPLLRDLSGAADRIKFAKGQGVIEEAERHLARRAR
jgi:ParB-like chromosome segregation protein Spo0J